ncbi:hypothetical protein B0H12DRAFT_1229076 [Mycena haematopus]|nr:hypothetical protein B0H12DRAFT_1229076 [Mycena haematopus]
MKIKRLGYGYSWWSKEWTYKNISNSKVMVANAAQCRIPPQENRRPTSSRANISSMLIQDPSILIQLQLEPEIFLTCLRDFSEYRDTLVACKRRTDRRFSSVDLLSFLSAIATIDRLTAHNEITFALLYAILVPRTLVVARCAATGPERFFRLHLFTEAWRSFTSETASGPPATSPASESNPSPSPIRKATTGTFVAPRRPWSALSSLSNHSALPQSKSEPAHQPSKSPSGNSVEPTADLAKAAHRRRGADRGPRLRLRRQRSGTGSRGALFASSGTGAADTKDAASMLKSGSVVSSGASTTTTTSTASTSPSASPGTGAGGSPIVQPQPPQNRDALSERLQAVQSRMLLGRHRQQSPSRRSRRRAFATVSTASKRPWAGGRDSMLGHDLADFLGTGGRVGGTVLLMRSGEVSLRGSSLRRW